MTFPPILVDLHCHTADHSFDGKSPAAEMLQAAIEAGFAGVVFTDHCYCWPEDELQALMSDHGLSGQIRVWSGQEVRVHRGGEILGDVLLFGVKQHLPDGTDICEAMALMREAGGFAIAAHVGMPGKGLGELVADYPIIAAETWNARYGPRHESMALRVVKGLDLILTGGSDAHEVAQAARGATAFQMDVNRLQSLRDIHEALLDGCCRPWKPNPLTRLHRWWRSLAP